MIEFDLDGHVYAGRAPVGEHFLRLVAPCRAAAQACGLFDAMLTRGQAGFFLAAGQLSTVPDARKLLLQVLKGWTVDGTEIDASSFAALYATPERCMEPWTALALAMERLGFFSLPGLNGPPDQEDGAEETPGED